MNTKYQERPPIGKKSRVANRRERRRRVEPVCPIFCFFVVVKIDFYFSSSFFFFFFFFFFPSLSLCVVLLCVYFFFLFFLSFSLLFSPFFSRFSSSRVLHSTPHPPCKSTAVTSHIVHMDRLSVGAPDGLCDLLSRYVLSTMYLVIINA